MGSGSLSGNIDGGAGSNSLDYSAYTAGPAIVNLQTSQASGLSGSFASIQAMLGNAGSTLIGPDSGSTFNVSSADAGNVNGAFNFSGVQNLTGGAGNDTFAFSGAATLTGVLNGSGGTNILDYSAYGSGVSVDLSTHSASNIYGGLANGVLNIQNLSGSHYADSLTGDSAANVINGNGGANSLNGGLGDDTYTFGPNWGSGVTVVDPGGNDTMTFAPTTANLTFDLGVSATCPSGLCIHDGLGDSVSNSGFQIENLIGGSGSNDFRVDAAAQANLNGGSGSSSLDYSNFLGGPVTFNLQNHTATGLTGTFTNMDAFIGSPDAGDVLVGVNTGNTFTVNGSNSGSVSNAAGSTTFSGVENLAGGIGSDTFDMTGAGQLTGGVDGTSGSDTLNFNSYGTPRSLTLSSDGPNGFIGTDSSAVASLGGGFANIDTLFGSSLPGDRLNGENVPSTWSIGSTTSYSTGEGNLAFSGFETLAGGSSDDTFAFANGAGFNGSIDGGAGDNTLDFHAYTSPCSVSLTGIGTAGYSGTTAAGEWRLCQYRRADRRYRKEEHLHRTGPGFDLRPERAYLYCRGWARA